VKLFQHGALIAHMADKETRLANGLIDNPPQLFVSCLDEERDDYKLVPIDWLVAKTLCPRDVNRISALIGREREARQLEAEHEKRVAELDEKIAALRPPEPAQQERAA
jgi:hypothetical protein